MIACIFPGQGSQTVGMGRALAETYPACRETFDEADEALGERLSRIIFEGPEERLTLTVKAHPAILTVSLAAYRVLNSRGPPPRLAAAHSLGLCSPRLATAQLPF